MKRVEVTRPIPVIASTGSRCKHFSDCHKVLLHLLLCPSLARLSQPLARPRLRDQAVRQDQPGGNPPRGIVQAQLRVQADQHRQQTACERTTSADEGCGYIGERGSPRRCACCTDHSGRLQRGLCDAYAGVGSVCGYYPEAGAGSDAKGGVGSGLGYGVETSGFVPPVITSPERLFGHRWVPGTEQRRCGFSSQPNDCAIQAAADCTIIKVHVGAPTNE
jgi:hypothetical protein